MREAFPDWEIEFKNSSRSDTLQRPFRITFPPLKQDDEGSKPKGGKRKAGGGGDAAADGEGAAEGDVAAGRKLVVESYTPVLPGPYPEVGDGGHLQWPAGGTAQLRTPQAGPSLHPLP